MKRSSLLLLELLLMILLFALCSVICVSILAKSWAISQESERLTTAVYLAESAASYVQGNREDFTEQDGAYRVSLSHEVASNGLASTLICVSYEGELVYSLTVSCQKGVP